MPLLDHFHPPLSRTHPWRAFHGAWAAAMARLLNAGVLPAGYYAVPFLDRDGPVEIDVATLQDLDSAARPVSGGAAWVPEAPSLTVAVEWPTLDEVRVEVFADDGDPRLAATVELVSPRNKDRPRAREAFTAKCREHLRQGRGVVVVDVVTSRRADLHADLLASLGADPIPLPDGTLSVVSYRPVVLAGAEQQAGQGELLAWPSGLEIGRPLPIMPLWLAADLVVPLDLEASHTAACTDLRIRQAG